eukprot:PhF_6_TR12572/c0_g1_i2/m.19740
MLTQIEISLQTTLSSPNTPQLEGFKDMYLAVQEVVAKHLIPLTQQPTGTSFSTVTSDVERLQCFRILSLLFENYRKVLLNTDDRDVQECTDESLFQPCALYLHMLMIPIEVLGKTKNIIIISKGEVDAAVNALYSAVQFVSATNQTSWVVRIAPGVLSYCVTVLCTSRVCDMVNRKTKALILDIAALVIEAAGGVRTLPVEPLLKVLKPLLTLNHPFWFDDTKEGPCDVVDDAGCKLFVSVVQQTENNVPAAQALFDLAIDMLALLCYLRKVNNNIIDERRVVIKSRMLKRLRCWYDVNPEEVAFGQIHIMTALSWCLSPPEIQEACVDENEETTLIFVKQLVLYFTAMGTPNGATRVHTKPLPPRLGLETAHDFVLKFCCSFQDRGLSILSFCLENLSDLSSWNTLHLGSCHVIAVLIPTLVQENKISSFADVVESITQPYLWDITLESDTPYTAEEWRHKYQTVVHILTVLERIYSCCSQESEEAAAVTMMCMYNVLEKMDMVGSNHNDTVRRAAQSVWDRMTASTGGGGGGSSSFIIRYGDYLIDDVIKRLLLVSLYPSTPRLVCSLFRVMTESLSSSTASCSSAASCFLLSKSLIRKILNEDRDLACSAKDVAAMMLSVSLYLKAYASMGLEDEQQRSCWSVVLNVFDAVIPYLHWEGIAARCDFIAVVENCVFALRTTRTDMGDVPNTPIECHPDVPDVVGVYMHKDALSRLHKAWQVLLPALFPPGVHQAQSIEALCQQLARKPKDYLIPPLDVSTIEIVLLLKTCVACSRPFLHSRAVKDLLPCLYYRMMSLRYHKPEPLSLAKRLSESLETCYRAIGITHSGIDEMLKN